ncbi:Ubiquitin-conjugating enzyme E2 6 [Rhizina undulata]
MATRAANKRLTREYKSIQENPPPYIQAHPSESNILEWHYIITGPEKTPYEGGQYWGTLVFPPEYPFKPPAIRMMTPSGRFQTSTRLCLSISDFHPKSFNPAWEVSTILIGLLSFMTSEEMTTGSLSVSESERRLIASRSRWWNSTGAGSGIKNAHGVVVANPAGGVLGRGVGWGDQGRRFRAEFPELDEENWKWMEKQRIAPSTGAVMTSAEGVSGNGDEEGLRLRKEGGPQVQAQWGPKGSSQGPAEVVVKQGESWIKRHKVLLGIVVLVGYVLVIRAFE